MELVASNNKVLEAYRIINQQVVQTNQQLKKELRLSEERFNGINDVLLRTRQENKCLRDMVRKLKDQLQMITKVMISVQEQTERAYDTIQRPHDLAEEMELNRQSRAPLVYEHMRMENPPCVHEAVIVEEAEESETTVRDGAVSQPVGNDTSVPCTEQENETETSRESSDAFMDESRNQLTLREAPAPTCGSLLPCSPLVQRLKRRSKNASFDESFETIERDRVYKLSRCSRERRQAYAGLAPEMTDCLREPVCDVAMEESPVLSLELPTVTRSQTSDANSDMDVEVIDTNGDSMRNMSPARIDEHNSSSTVGTQTEQQLLSCYAQNGIRGPSVLKKTASESMLSTLCRPTEPHVDANNSSTRSHDDTTVFLPTNASCSTPVSKGAAATAIHQASSVQTRPLGRTVKTKSETALNQKSLPVVVLHPLTEENVRSLGVVLKRGERIPRTARGRGANKDQDDGSSNWESTRLDPSSSTENLSVTSNESGRPRRKAAPTMLREPSIGVKLRRK